MATKDCADSSFLESDDSSPLREEMTLQEFKHFLLQIEVLNSEEEFHSKMF